MDKHYKLFIQMSGAPGSGKSTTAKFLAPKIDAAVIDHDPIRSSFLDNGVPFGEAAKLAYDLQWTVAEDTIKDGRSVIVDSPCNYEEALDRGTSLARQYGFEYKYVECRVDNIDVLDSRLRARVPMRSQRTGLDRPPMDAGAAHGGEDQRALFERWMKVPCRPAGGVVVVDSTQSPEKCLESILDQFAAPSDVQRSSPGSSH